jgi:hypothetical protein
MSIVREIVWWYLYSIVFIIWPLLQLWLLYLIGSIEHKWLLFYSIMYILSISCPLCRNMKAIYIYTVNLLQNLQHVVVNKYSIHVDQTCWILTALHACNGSEWPDTAIVTNHSIPVLLMMTEPYINNVLSYGLFSWYYLSEGTFSISVFLNHILKFMFLM